MSAESRFLNGSGSIIFEFPGARVIESMVPQKRHDIAPRCTGYSGGELAEALPPIGRPIANTRVYVLDEQGEPVPVGVNGELYIGGAGVARGYLKRPELTAERFVPDPYGEEAGARLYRTGDVGRWRADGNVEFVGRNDFQVKVRGFRIELGEIESRLAEQAGVREAVVVVREDTVGDKRLVAYYTARQPEDGVGAEQMRAHLAAKLPEYMVPEAYVRLEALPLTPNGKLDRRGLPAPEAEAYAVQGYEPPQGETEKLLAEIWAEVLHVERVGRHDNFFALGGHSLLAITLVERMRQGSFRVDVRSIYTTPTIAGLVAAGLRDQGVVVPPNQIKPGTEAITPEMLPLLELTQEEIKTIVAGVPGGVANVQDIYPLAPLQEGILFHHLMGERRPYLHTTSTRLRYPSVAGGVSNALQAVIDRNDILRTAIAWEGLREPVQVVWRRASLGLEEVQLDPAAGEASAQLYARVDPRQRRLDLRQAPMLRAYVAREAESDGWVMLLLHHHLVVDHTTMDGIRQEVRAHLLGRQHELPAPLPFRNLVAEARLGVSKEEHEAFFRRMLGDVEEPTAPFGMLDVRGDGSGIEKAHMEVGEDLARRLRANARQLQVSVASLCHVAWARVLSTISGREDVVFGTVLFGRLQGGEGVDRALGLFINTLPVRIQAGGEGVESAVHYTHNLLADLSRHEHASLALAQRCSAVPAPLPLFSSLLNYRYGASARRNSEESASAWQGIRVVSQEERTNYPVTLSVDDWGEDFSLTAQVQGSLKAMGVCSLMHQALESLVEALETEPAKAVRGLEVLPAAERHRVLYEWNDTKTEYPRERCVQELFEEQVAKTPDAVAVVYEEQQLSYGELNRRANQLAHYLRELGVKPDDRVALCLERSPEMVVALLAVLKAEGRMCRWTLFILTNVSIAYSRIVVR